MSFKLVFPVLVFQFNIGIVPEENILKNSFKHSRLWSLDTVLWKKCENVGLEEALFFAPEAYLEPIRASTTHLFGKMINE